MSTASRGLSAYRQASSTVTPALQIVMLYDGAMRFVREAGRAAQEGRIEDRHLLVARAYGIVNALHCCLDFDQGGTVAPALDRFYSYILHRLTLADIRNDPAICAEVAQRLAEMRASWAAIAEGAPVVMSPPAAQPSQLALTT